jgi:hypothetical protein
MMRLILTGKSFDTHMLIPPAKSFPVFAIVFVNVFVRRLFEEEIT